MVILLLTFSRIVESCGEGCLKCGTNNLCNFCDSQKFYYLVSGKCELKEIPNCRNIDLNGNCLLCKSAHYYDQATQKCVSSSVKIDNCERQLSSTTCEFCRSGFYLDNGKCLALKSPIPNCLYHQTEALCLQCNEGYLNSADQKQCVQNPSISGCAIYSNYKCQQCQDSYFMNRNFYIESLFDNLNSENLFKYLQANFYNIGNAVVPTSCETITTNNCKTQETANKCNICNPGYFLKEDRSCERNPYVPIDNCKTYSNFNKCTNCNESFWLQNATTCKPIILIPNCILYDQTKESQCLTCAGGYYLASNTCQQRNVDILNCSEFEKNTQLCQTCGVGFEPTSDKKKCLTIVPNCREYFISSENNDKLLCSKCEQFKYLNQTENVCLDGTVQNCRYYGNTEVNCLQCNNGFYLAGNSCKIHQIINQCKTFSLSTPNVCEDCEPNHINFAQLNGCLSHEPILHCATYSALSVCATCIDGYYLKTNTSLCDTITESNCLDKVDNGNGCTKCNHGFYIDNIGQCKPFYHYKQEYCTEIKNNGTNLTTLDCDQCNAYHYPFEFRDHFVCIHSDRLETNNEKIANCYKHKNSTGSKTCIQCDPNYYVADDGTCTLCATDMKQVYKYTGTSGAQAFTVNEIIPGACTTMVGDCKVQALTVYGATTCVECNTGFVRIQENDKILYNYSSTFGNQDKDLGVSYPSFSCTTYGGKNFYPSGSALTVPNDNCLSYKAEGDTNFYCQQCVFGKTGPIVEGTHNYINCNQDVSGCENDYYGGFHFDFIIKTKYNIDSLNQYSCHNCSNSDEIVFIHLDMTAPWNAPSLAAYNLDQNSTVPKNSVNELGTHTACRKLRATDLGFTEQQFSRVFVSNCAMALYNVGITKAFATSDTPAVVSFKCMECKPGFRKVLNAAGEVSNCQAIEFCDLDAKHKYVNYCSQCKLGYAWAWDEANKKINYSECIPNNSDNGCLTVSQTNLNGQSNYCRFCKKGFFFNDDGRCEEVKVAKCKNGKFEQILETFFVGTNYNEKYLIEHLLPNGQGCSECEQGYLPSLRVNQSNIACVQSPYVAKKELIQGTKFIKNCEDYHGNQIPFKCKTCQDNYIISSDLKSCYPQNNYTNCKVVSATTFKCEECQQQFALRKNLCELAEIQHCVNYDPNANSQLCLLCQEGYYPINNNKECKLGLIPHCKIYTSQGQCQECSIGFGLLTLLDNKTYCLELKQDLFCNKIKESVFKQHQYECTECVVNYGITTDTTKFNRNVCLKIDEVINCVQHDVNSTISNSTLRCEECSDNFFVFENGLVCKDRESTIAHCSLKDKLSDKCGQCQEFYYLANDGAICEEYPVGIKYCTTYSAKTTCVKCTNGYYLDSNVCIKVPDEKLIDKCVEYGFIEATLSCLRCDTNYFYTQEKKCILTKAQNCLTYTNESTCSTCDNGFVFFKDTVNNTTNCQSKTIQHCNVIDAVSANCIQCNINYYPNSNGDCSLSTVIIQNCMIYSKQGECAKCNPSTYLSADMKSCLQRGNFPLLDNCLEAVFEDKLNCAACKPGQYFKNGICQDCSISFIEGCLSCNPESPDVCLVCATGYHQKNNDGVCHANQVTAEDNTDRLNGSFVKIVEIFVVLFMCLF